MKSTSEIIIGIMKTNGKVPLVNSLGDLRPPEKESVKLALKELGTMLTELSYRKRKTGEFRRFWQ